MFLFCLNIPRPAPDCQAGAGASRHCRRLGGFAHRRSQPFHRRGTAGIYVISMSRSALASGLAGRQDGAIFKYLGGVMTLPLMPKATAVWLVENTGLTFDQIAEFCGLHALEVQAIADGEVAAQMQGLDPVANGQITAEEIKRCEQDPAARLQLSEQAQPVPLVKHKGPRYTPIAKRQDKPDTIAWLVKNHPELSDGQISKLVGTTKPTIGAVRDRTHCNSPHIQPL